jgi:hypothetical protein
MDIFLRHKCLLDDCEVMRPDTLNYIVDVWSWVSLGNARDAELMNFL